jgi:NAD(P)-dependent dehydrogenase (short-subunit alcohol dehydrogenase family)
LSDIDTDGDNAMARAVKSKARQKARLRKPVVIITGAASGIGRATVDVMLEKGWRVAALDRDEAALRDLRRTFKRPGKQSGDVMALAVDVCDEAAVGAVVNSIAVGLGGIDGVVNSAGIAADIPALDTPVDVFKRILDVNVIGSFIVARAAARWMKAQRSGGAIVNIASISGLRGSKGRVAYGASKGAIVTMTQVLANDLAPLGIRVNAIAPGPIETPMVRQVHSKADRALYMRYVPMARYGTPKEIATAIAFLLDEEAAGYITGEILAVDGGYRGAGIIPGRK